MKVEQTTKFFLLSKISDKMASGKFWNSSFFGKKLLSSCSQFAGMHVMEVSKDQERSFEKFCHISL